MLLWGMMPYSFTEVQIFHEDLVPPSSGQTKYYSTPKIKTNGFLYITYMQLCLWTLCSKWECGHINVSTVSFFMITLSVDSSKI
jgi:hypothetical protein